MKSRVRRPATEGGRQTVFAAALVTTAAFAAAASGGDMGILPMAHGLEARATSRPVRLVLQDATGAGGPVALDLTVRDGRVEKDLWAAAWSHNHRLHPGSAAASQADVDNVRLSVRVTVLADPIAPGGEASYQIDLKRQGDEFRGAYTGAFLDRPVKGTALGGPGRPSAADVPGLRPLRPGEHPRLIFRADDLPGLRRRMETPEGQAIMAMLLKRSPLRQPDQVSDRHTSWMAANWGAIWQLAGQQDAPQKARQVLMDDCLTKPMPPDRKDIHRATRLLGIALTYDLCYDAWDEEFRRLVAEYLDVAAADLADGVYQGFAMDAEAFDPAPWGHRSAIRMASAGCAALAVLGDAGADGRPLPDAARVASAAEHHVATYLRMGITQSGTGLEGPFYKDFALAGGVLQFLQASRAAAGRDLAVANPMLLAGSILQTRPQGEGALDFGLASISIQASGLWPVGLGAAPQGLLPALKWCFDRDVGLAGKRHFGCAYPYQAAYALANYPFDVEARPPGEALPLMVDDTDQGHFTFRDRWQDADDVLIGLYLNLQSMPPVRMSEGDLSAGALNVTGLGGAWLRGFAGPRRLNDAAGADLLYSRVEGRQALVGMDLTPCYTTAPERPRRGRAREAPLVRLPRRLPTAEEVRQFLSPARPAGPPPGETQQAAPETPKPNFRMVRHVAVDLSGDCGSPVLMAIVDRCEGIEGPWRVLLPAKLAASEPGRFVCGDPAGPTLTGWIAAPTRARLSGGTLPAAGEYFVVMTLQPGPPPAAAVEGEGLAATIALGGRTVAFDGQRIVLGRSR
jgi:hypothetical protein